MNMQKLSNSTSSVAIYYDRQNVSLCSKELSEVLRFANSMGAIRIKKAYANWSSENKRHAQFVLCISDFDCLSADPTKKNSADERLIADCRQQVLNSPDINVVILITGDKDFAQLIGDLREKGKTVIVIVKYKVSQKLVKRANKVYFVEQLYKQAA